MAGFYSARRSIMPPLPWTTFAPPLSLGGLVGFLIWLWLSVALLIVGAEINAELEHQTARDSTTGTPLPIGSRGAHMADTIGKAAK